MTIVYMFGGPADGASSAPAPSHDAGTMYYTPFEVRNPLHHANAMNALTGLPDWHRIPPNRTSSLWKRR